ncbi:MAG: hypothetical protein A2176_11815 [Spirochaetes bacterium RBG_13_51_14]|nr:MAG: hypothetical protein A2176_11815 [Spirochaetes bacterium RBG_13_51_14]
MIAYKNRFSQDDIKSLEPTEKVALVATVNPEGQPHVTLLTSLQALAPTQMIMGEFSKGLSKEYMKTNSNIGFLIMTLDRHLWRGTARWTHQQKEGPEYERMNNKPMFRYNTYFGINTVHYFDLMKISVRQSLPLASIGLAALKTKFARGGARRNISAVLKPFALSILDRIDSLKFLSYIDTDGLPVLIPVIQCRAADSGRLAFAVSVYEEEFAAIPKGTVVAVFAMTMKMEDILVRGIYNGVGRFRGVKLATVDVTWAYNAMPPAHGQIYPETELKTVTIF